MRLQAAPRGSCPLPGGPASRPSGWISVLGLPAAGPGRTRRKAAGQPALLGPRSLRAHGGPSERSALAQDSARRPSSRDSPVPTPPRRPAGSGADDSPGGGVAGRRWASPGLGAARPLRRPARGVPVSGQPGRQSGRRAPIGRAGGGGRGSAAFQWAAPASPPRRP